MSPGFDTQGIAVYLGIDTGLGSSKVSVPRLVRTRIGLFAHASTYSILVI